MIRYVIAVVLATAVLGLGFAALDEGAAIRGERATEGAVAAVERGAVSLVEHDDVVPGASEPARRVVEIDLPVDSRTSRAVETLVFERIEGTNATLARYRVPGRSEQQVVIDAPIVSADGAETVDLGGAQGRQTLVLELVAGDEQRPVVRVSQHRF